MVLTRVCLAALCLATLIAARPVRAQSLADLAKRTQEQRDKAKTGAGADAAKPAADAGKDQDQEKKGKKVYTDQDLKDLQPMGGAAPASDAKATTADAPGDKAGAALKDAARGEAYWRARWTPVAERIKREEEQAAATRRRIDELTFQLRSLGALATQRGDMLAERQRAIALEKALNEQVVADKAALATIVEEGRNAGALPGWFR